MIKTASIIGAGNVANQLGKALIGCGITINSVHSKTQSHSKQLAEILNAKSVEKANEIDAELILIAVNDDSIKLVSNQLITSGIVVHTSGAKSMTQLSQHKNYGVFYPLQTLSQEVNVDFQQIPIAIEGSNEYVVNSLTEVGQKLSNTIVQLSSIDREKIHLAAVFVNNFANQFYHLANSYLADNQLDFNLLKPLILETALKIQNKSPLTLQTGPAKRNDIAVIQQHLHLLKEYPDMHNLYTLVSESITKTHNELP